MRRFAYTTDIHLNFVDNRNYERFTDSLQGFDGVLITGDIAEADSIVKHLTNLANAVDSPIYFVLGNHDFYHGSFGSVRADMSELCNKFENLHYLPDSGVIKIDENSAICGVDGWYDGRCGFVAPPKIEMYDWSCIENIKPFHPFNGRDQHLFLDKIQAIADAQAEKGRMVVQKALKEFDNVVFLTHVPPWEEASTYAGRMSNDAWRPWFCSRMMGFNLNECFRQATTNREVPEKSLTVLAGHTHGETTCTPKPGIICHIGGADYSFPEINKIVVIDNYLTTLENYESSISLKY